jgi:hypothetical protein
LFHSSQIFQGIIPAALWVAVFYQGITTNAEFVSRLLFIMLRRYPSLVNANILE